MGKIITRGTAVREVQYDKVLITLEFMAREAESRRAIKKVTEESEAFLKELENAGMDLSEIEAGANSVKKNNWNDDHTVDVTRGFSFDLDYDLAYRCYPPSMQAPDCRHGRCALLVSM